MTNWVPIDVSFPAFGREVLIKCKGWEPMLATYIANPHCQFKEFSQHECCGIWMVFDYKNTGRLLSAPVEAWCEIPKPQKNKK